MYKSVTLYDAKLRDQNGNGYYTHNLKIDGMKKKAIEEAVKQIRDRQKKLNASYRKTNKPVKKRVEVESEESEGSQRESESFDNIIHSPDIDINIDPGTGNTILLLGSSKAGKSTVMMRIYEKYFAKGYISTLYSSNPHIEVYKKHKKLLICDTFNAQTEKLIKMEKYINKNTNNHYNFLNMFDDILDVRYNKLINNMIMTYRNSNMSTIMALQYTSLISKSARSNVNVICFFRFNTDESIEVVINMFLKGIFSKMGYKDMQDQINFYKDVTNDHGFIYYYPVRDAISFHRLNLTQ